MRVVLDSNILISAFFWNGNERLVLRACLSGPTKNVISDTIMVEVDHVFRNKFDLDDSRVLDYLMEILVHSDLVIPLTDVDHKTRDTRDNHIIETGVLGRSELIITGDEDLLSMTEIPGIQTVSAKGFLELLTHKGSKDEN